MKPGLIFHFTAGAFCFFLAVITKASPVPTSPDQANVLVPPTVTTENEPSVDHRSSGASIDGVRPNQAQVPGKPRETKRVHWLDDQMEPLHQVIPNTHETAGLGHDQDNSQISSSELKGNLLAAQRMWIDSRTPMPRFILPQDKGHFKVEVQEIHDKIEGYESALRELAHLYVKEHTFDDERWKQTQIELLKSQRAEIITLVSSEGARLDYQRSWILPKLLQALNIFLFPVFQQELRGRSIRNQAIQQIIYYQRLDKEHLGKTNWKMCHDKFTHKEAAKLFQQATERIAMAKAKEEWISSQTPIHSEVAQMDPFNLQQKRWETAKTSRANLLKFANGEQDYEDETLRRWQTDLLDSQQAMFKKIPPTAHYEQSVALQLLLEGLKMFLFPVYRKVKYIADVRAVPIGKIIYYQRVLQERHGIIDWEKCSDDPNNFTDEKAQHLLEKVEELLKSKPDSGKE